MSRKKSTASTTPADREILFDQLKQIAQGLGETFAPFCEGVLHDRLRASPHQHPVDVPVAAIKRASLQVFDRLAQHQRAIDEAAAHKCLAADVNGLILERHAFVLAQYHRMPPV